MTRTRRAMFLERAQYRKSRIRDAARLLPVLGLVLLLLPDLVLSDPQTAQGATARGLVYFFGVWAGLIALAWLLSWRLRALKAMD